MADLAGAPQHRARGSGARPWDDVPAFLSGDPTPRQAAPILAPLLEPAFPRAALAG